MNKDSLEPQLREFLRENDDEMSLRFIRLCTIMRALRSPNGCPWDKEQTPESIKKYLLEETYELLEAIDNNDSKNVMEEAGDLLFLLIFLVCMYEEKGEFSFSELLFQTGNKMIRRHPHVFGDEMANDAKQVISKWRSIKKEEDKEKGRKYSVLGHLPLSLPALQRAYRIGERASRVGFDWESAKFVFDKLEEEERELKDAIESNNKVAIKHELGDVLFAVANLSRLLDINPEEALSETVKRFESRFHFMEDVAQKRGLKLDKLTIDELEALWQEAKSKEAKNK